jgi:hypothetical protein
MSAGYSRVGRNVRRVATLAAAIALTAPACSSDEVDSSATTVPSSATVATAVPATTAPPTTAPAIAPPTTAPPTTAPATVPPTTVPPSTVPPSTMAPPLTPADLSLLSDGIGPLRFGDPEDDMVTRLSAVLGAPTDTFAVGYPIPVDGVYATDEFGEERFVHPTSSTTCFDNGLCVVFGGPAAGALTLVGWSQDSGTGALATPEGITVGSRWAEHPAAMTVDEGGCFSAGSGSTAGIYLWVQSQGTPFLEALPDGTLVTHVPDPADVVVTRLESGDLPYWPFIDC